MKRFEEEYREYVRQNAPDLWDRIEAGVDERMAETKSSKGRKKKTKKYYRYMRLAASVAACLAALVLAVPVLHFVSEKGAGQSAADIQNGAIENIQEPEAGNVNDAGGAVDTAAPRPQSQEETQMAVTEDAGETEEIEEIAYDDDNDETVSEQTEEAQEDAMPQSGTEDMTTLAQAPDSETETESDGDMSDAEPDVLSDMIQAETVRVKVLAKEQTDDGIIYTVEILEGSGIDVQTAQTWTVTAANGQQILKTEKEYHLVLKDAVAEDMTAVLERVVE